MVSGVKIVTDELVILDFETTGLSPAYARVIEVAAVRIKGGKVVDTLSQLMHPGHSIPYFITEITGITNQMIKGMPSPEKFMPTLIKFIGDRPILAHNASFDQKFLVAELANTGKAINNTFLCTLKLARRLIQNVPDYKLSTLTACLKLKVSADHKAHRALSDVTATFQLWLHMKKLVASHIDKEPDFSLFLKLEKQPKAKILKFLDKHFVT
jgi:DNA polymerase-3 subunit epsilon